MRSRKISLKKALRLGEIDVIALVGAGGKTSLLFSIAREFDSPVLLSATTHLGIEQLTLADRHVVVRSQADLLPFDIQLPDGITLLTGEEGDDARTKGLNEELIEQVFQLAKNHNAPLIIEADGARMLPLKAPAHHEPPIPQFVDRVIVVAGLSGLGQPIRDVVHRIDQFCELTNKSPRDLVDPQDIITVLKHPEGGLKNIPENAKKIAMLNQAQTYQQKISAGRIAEKLLDDYQQVISADVVLHRRSVIHSIYEPIAGIVLAAGSSERMGQPKQLLEWGGKSLIRSVLETALRSKLDEVLVVLGANADLIREDVADLPVRIVINEDWAEGQSASVKAGVGAINPEAGGALFLLADQPRMTETLINSVIETHRATFQSITIPMINGRRGNPVLFDRSVFPELLNLRGDIGGRSLFSRFEVEHVTWVDPMVAQDVDTQEDYQNLIED